MSGYESVFLCALTPAVERWGVGGCSAWQKHPGEMQGLDWGPSGEAGPFTSAS